MFRGCEHFVVAGRTDAGVHALGQVVSLAVERGPPLERVAEALNAVLPDDVSVVSAEELTIAFTPFHGAFANVSVPDLAAAHLVAVRAARRSGGSQDRSARRNLPNQPEWCSDSTTFGRSRPPRPST